MKGVKGVLIDLDGVLYEGECAVKGGAECIDWLREAGIPHLFLTNTTSRPRTALIEKLAGMGIETQVHDFLTPPVAALRWISDHAPGPSALFVPSATRAEFAALDVLPEDAETGAASVVIGDLGEGWSFATLNRAFRLLIATPPPVLIALGMTRYWRAPDGLRLDVAPFVKALEHASGAQAVVLGKPAEAFFDTAARSLDVPASEIVMIGDDIVGDVEGAQHCGLKGALVRTGKFDASDLERGIQPDAVLDSIAELRGWWERESAPDHPAAAPGR